MHLCFFLFVDLLWIESSKRELRLIKLGAILLKTLSVTNEIVKKYRHSQRCLNSLFAKISVKYFRNNSICHAGSSKRFLPDKSSKFLKKLKYIGLNSREPNLTKPNIT